MIAPQRKRLRLPTFDYREVGWYFVTICAFERRHLFGEIVDARLRATELGRIVAECWADIPAHHPHVAVDEFVVMPNHVHGLLEVRERPSSGHAATAVSPGALGSVIRSFKSAVTRKYRGVAPGATAQIWQRSYYEHVLRRLDSVEYVRWYIRSNPERWEIDAENRARTGRDPFNAWLTAQRAETSRLSGSGTALEGGEIV